ncbi:MAG: FG-GAP-like repeat-containing protein [Methanosarcina sp.]
MNRTLLILFVLFSLAQDLLSQQFTEAASLTGVGQGSVAWGDYNNDGYADVLMSGWSDTDAATLVCSNNGDGTFSEQVSIILPGVLISSVGWADLDNDNDLDILITGSTTGNTLDAISKVFRNNAGTFTEIASGLPGAYLSSTSFADFDRDGDTDILLTGMQTTGERISAIFSNDGNAFFTQVPGTAFTKVCYGYASFGDYDNDGYPDVLISGQTASITRVSKLYRNVGDGTFDENTSIILQGLWYGSGAWSDLNNDGYSDIILSGEDAAFQPVTKIYLNDKNGSFIQQTASLPGARKCSLASGDVDNDGDNDFILSGERGSAKISEVYINDGSAAFSLLAVETITGTTESSVALADLDNDRDLDLLLAGLNLSGNPVTKIYRNNITTVNSKPAKPVNLAYSTDKTNAVLSWDKANDDKSVSLSYNVRIGSTATGNNNVSPIADINGNRKVFLPGNTQLNNKTILKKLRWNTIYYASVQALDNSYTGGEFSDAISFQITPAQPTKLIGKFLTTASLLLRWKRGNGDRCIVFAREGASGPSAPVNSTTYYANSSFGDGSPLGATGWFCIYKGEADSVLLSGLSPDKDYTVHAIEMQGVNGSELYAANVNPDNDNIGVFSSGIFTPLSGSSMPGLRFSSVAWGDYDNDGYPDILLTGRLISGEDISKVFRNNGDNSFEEQTGITLIGVESGSCAWGDYNNDELLDIVLTGSNSISGPVSKIYKNNGNNTFTEQGSIALTGVTYSSTRWIDYDNDGDIDLFLSGNDSSNIPVSRFYRNNGNGTFTEQTGIIIAGVSHCSSGFGDYDNDGLPDLLISGLNSSGVNITRLYRNNGNNSFSEQTNNLLQPVSYGAVAWGDCDNDGRLDILVSGAAGYSPDFKPVTKVYHNNGNNSFSELTGTNLMGISNGTAEWGDYNNDGYLDILLIGDIGYDYRFSIYLNTGINNFTELPSLNLPGAIACGSSSADYDMDGDLDILFSGYSGALISGIYRNNHFMMAGKIKPNVRPEAPTGLSAEVKPHYMTLSWNGVRTDETYYVNMSYNVRVRKEQETVWTVAPQASTAGFRSLNDMGNAQLNRSFTIKDPSTGKYYWQVQAVDQTYSGSAWSKPDSVVIKSTLAYFSFDTVCLGLPTTFRDLSVAADGLASWKWDFSDGTSSTTTDPVHQFSSSGNFGVKLVIKGSNGAMDSLVRTVIVKPKPSVAFTSPNVCIGTPTEITNTTDLHGLTASAWSWKFGDGQTSAAKDPGTHNYALSGSFKASLKTTAINGCADSIIQDVIVAKYPEKAISVAGDFSTEEGKLTFCEGGSLQLNATNDTLYTYQWRMDGNDLTGATAGSYNVNRNSGVFTASITNTLAGCVSVSESKNINIKTAPAKPVITSDNYKTGDCIGENPVRLKIEQPVNNYSYVWMRNGTILNNATSSFIEEFLPQGDYVAVAALNGCNANSDKFSITYQGAPEKPVVYAQGPLKWYLACNNLNASKYLWYYNGKLIDGAFSYYYVANQNLGVYQVRVGDTKGCFTTSDTIRIPMDKYADGLKSFHTEDPFKNLKMYPNPSNGIINILMDNELYGDLEISVISQGGKEIRKLRLEKTTIHFNGSIDLTGQTKGV